MTLIELFENKPVQDVGTFNSIFVTCPIIGFNHSDSVEILGPVRGGRRILVNGKELVLDIPNSIVTNKNNTRAKRIKLPKKTITVVNSQAKPLPIAYKALSPGQFMVYSALKELGEVYNVTKFSQMLNMSYRAIQENLKELYRMGLVRSESVNTSKGNTSKISIDTSKVLL
jgi:hypothetical protein